MKTHPTLGTILFVGLLLIAAAVLSGCASIENAGHASYTVTRTASDNGTPTFELAVRDGKEFAERQIHFQTVGGAATLTIIEGASKAFPGQALAVKALTVLPVTGLSDLLK